ncbi:predicted protein [Verticillium alfalfae VaMs.102]|uniref:Predicted protein n=1 Tax=Verticillium alfalfae (strain VaMs.102 / ATCC MYA-4576 / FGSC 10136) TaxID=526221 RepID=C9SCL2_VERA1|nr:predicted protein [Verticillium alfalfae VaMs.102]EEY16827.1 predicted protein [Verticillium alfalfae VaMs.102]
MDVVNIDVLVVNDVVEVVVKVVEMTTVTEVEVRLVDTLEEGVCVMKFKLIDVVVVDVTLVLAVGVLVVLLLNKLLIERVVELLVAGVDVTVLLAKRVAELVVELSVELVNTKLLALGAETTMLVDEVFSLLNDELNGGLVFTGVVELAESKFFVEGTSIAELELGSVLNDALNVLMGEERIVEVPEREIAAASEEKLAIWLLDKIELNVASSDESGSTEELRTRIVEVLGWVKEPRLVALVVISPVTDVELLITAEDACISDVESRVEYALTDACSEDMELETSDVTLGELEISRADVVDSKDNCACEDVTTTREDLFSSVEDDCMLAEAVVDDTASVVIDTSVEDLSY